jgi:hypothetical protein
VPVIVAVVVVALVTENPAGQLPLSEKVIGAVPPEVVMLFENGRPAVHAVSVPEGGAIVRTVGMATV